MHFQNFLGAAAALIVTATASLVTTRSYTAPSFRATSELKNVSTYHELTRMRSPVRQPRGAYHNGLSSRSGGYGLSPTTAFGNNQGYYTPIKVGDQTFNVLVDTGSSDTWLLAEGAQCFNSAGELTTVDCNFGPEWNQKGCVPVPNQNFNIPYGGVASVSGNFCTIDVTLGAITANKQQIAVASSVAAFGISPSSGVLGLAYPALTFGFSGANISADDRATNQVPYNPLFTTMVQQGKVLPIFSIALSRASPYSNNDGYLALGGLPPVLTIGAWGASQIQYVAQDQEAGGYLPTVLPYPQHEWYTITPDAFLFQPGSQIIYYPNQWQHLPQPTGNLSFENQYILDSGYTDLALPPILADSIAAKFNPPGVYNPDYGNYTVPCNAVAPWFAIEIGGVVFPIDRRDMVIDDQSGLGHCMAGTTNAGKYAPYALGDVFMNNVVAVFDVGSGQMKFGARGIY